MHHAAILSSTVEENDRSSSTGHEAFRYKKSNTLNCENLIISAQFNIFNFQHGTLHLRGVKNLIILNNSVKLTDLNNSIQNIFLQSDDVDILMHLISTIPTERSKTLKLFYVIREGEKSSTEVPEQLDEVIETKLNHKRQ